ncbi:DegT/DnrJ/EryC1/StrS family aminotransferase [Staphylospora marina]|uniref:DegT/DnrJ/EryC1/StrS family aminotransferase n=1 Tax=Staphylospora marina TaxID=2490858 RepID=UPI000F5B95EB|nr:DegT/DnrJ/EryC1/StrS family aminotransferase [Staphylospora marina]
MIPLIDLSRQHMRLKRELEQALNQVMQSGTFVLGEEGRALEREVAGICETAHAVAVNSGTDALFLALKAAGIGPGDEVITTPYTFFATVEAIIHCGATPVFADVEPDTFNLDPAAVEAAVTKRTKAVIPVHLFGCPADMTQLSRLADQHGLKIIEDACQAIGAKWSGKPVGSWGMAGCFSFYPTKNLGGCGDGGMIVTEDAETAERLRRLRTHGTVKKYHHAEAGHNSRLDEFQAAILRVKLRFLSEWNKRRRVIADRYTASFQNLPVEVQRVPDEAEAVWHLYVIRTPRARDLEVFLKQSGIGCGIYYPLPLHHQEALRQHFSRVSLPRAEALAGNTLALPVFPELTEAEQQFVIDRVKQFFA